jgi:hypothetical protein
MHSPSEEHMKVEMRILRYLKGAPERGISFRRSKHLEIIGYSDADWVGCAVDQRSTAEYFTFVGENLVSWKSKK